MNRQSERAHKWLDADALLAMPAGIAVAVETLGRHDRRILGRIAAATPTGLDLLTPRGELTVPANRIKRARTVAALYEPGDPVLRRQVSATTWRGGVVRCEGTDVLVEQIDGTFAWLGESEIEHADARDVAPPRERRGPVPARSG